MSGNTYVFSHNGYVLHSYEWYDDINRETCYAWALKQNGELVMRSSYGRQLYDTQEKANEFIEGCVEVMRLLIQNHSEKKPMARTLKQVVKELAGDDNG